LSCPPGGDSQSPASIPLTDLLKARLWGGRFLVLALLLFSEILYLSIRFDTDAINVELGWWAWPLHQVPLALQAAVAIAATLLVFSGSEYRVRLETFFLTLRRPHHVWPLYTILHLVALGVFIELTSLAVAQPENLAAVSWIWFAIWVGIAGMVFLFWLLAFIPWSAWRAVLQESRGLVLAGIAIGVSAVGFGLLAQSLAPPLATATFSGVDFLLRLAGESPVSFPQSNTIGIHNFSVSIAPSCSGLEGIGLVSVFLLVYLWTSRTTLRFPQALWLLPMGCAVIWISNAFRIAALVWIGAHGSEQLALGGFHSQAGWIAFNMVALGIVAVSQKARLFTIEGGSSQVTSGPNSSSNPASPYLVPFLVLVATGMVLQATTTQPATWYPIRVLVMLGCLYHYSKFFPRLSVRFSSAPIVIGLTVGLLWLLLMPAEFIATGGAVNLAQTVPYGMSLWWVVRIIGYVLLVPVVEELAFRGYLIRRLIQPEFEKVSLETFSWFAWIASSVLFGLMHSPLWFPGILAGLLFGLAVYRRGNLADAIVAHMSANGLIAVYAVATSQWALLS
jgi:exosortase E/protease (VPEID-CTERM system)